MVIHHAWLLEIHMTTTFHIDCHVDQHVTLQHGFKIFQKNLHSDFSTK